MSCISDLSATQVNSKNQNQFLGQTATKNPLLELAQGIMGNAATAQGRGDMAFGGGGGVPTIQSYSDPLGQVHQQVAWKGGFKTPGVQAGTPTVPPPPATPPPAVPPPGPGITPVGAGNSPSGYTGIVPQPGPGIG